MRAKNNWKTIVAAPIVLAMSCLVFAIPAAGAQIGFGIQFGRTPPPVLRYEERPPMPGPGYAWVDGHWGWRDGRYVWVPGEWRRPPFAGAFWSDGYWTHYPDGWHWQEGHWDREDHDYHYDWKHDRDHHDDHHDDHGH